MLCTVISVLSHLKRQSHSDRFCTFCFLGAIAAGRISSTRAFVPQNSFLYDSGIRDFSNTMLSAAKKQQVPIVPHVEDVPAWMLAERTRIINGVNNTKKDGKCVLYWMQRDVRTNDNWALLYANHLALEAGVPLRVVYCLPPPPEEEEDDEELPPKLMLTAPMTERYGTFLLGGIEIVYQQLKSLDVPFYVIEPSSTEEVGSTIMNYCEEWKPGSVICDTSPLKPYRSWMEDQLSPLLKGRKIPLIQVDAHNVVPVWHASPKREVGARTLRPKLNKLMDKFLTDYPSEFPLSGNAHLDDKIKSKIDFPDFTKESYAKFLKWDESVPSLDWCEPGAEKAVERLESFINTGLSKFDALRNDPNLGREICSNLSPWINHGHISYQTVARRVKKLNRYASGTASFLEEGIVRRELSDNFVYYTRDEYDSLEAAAGWAKESLSIHESDVREWIFSLQELEEGRSHDDLWNAAQLQLITEGKLHGFLRMYWAKKILEWTESPNIALRTAQYLNDKYNLDGCDPNGFVGVGWSIFGLHDQGWKEREIFGKIRYMNYAGCKRKFKVDNFVAKYPGALNNAIAAAKKYGKARETGKPVKKKTSDSDVTTSGKGKTAGVKRKR